MSPLFRRLPLHHPVPHRVPRGASLVLVLAALALVSFLTIAILTFIRSESRSSQTAADLVEARLLSTLPEKLIISQLRRATADLGTTLTWASQPGMIRVFNVGVPNVQSSRLPPFEVFKLYSSDQMSLSGSKTSDLAEDFDQWAKQRARYTDLNEPVRVLPPRKQGAPAVNDEAAVIFPILDPRALGVIDGFSFTDPPGNANDSETAFKHPFPMPVQWIYVLRDGTLSSPSGATESTVRIARATKDNPVVGRVAFWTDDESCKLNINTATEPSPWQPPLTKSIGDAANATSIPGKNEFYRMSGHPAFTSLSPVLRNLGKSGSSTDEPKHEPQDALGSSAWWSHLTAWHDLMPRTFSDRTANDGSRGGSAAATNEVRIKQSRLFASVDELFFIPGLTNNSTRPEWTGTGDAPKFNQDDLRKAEFFLTPHSRAPETNPFNGPKISLWPVQESTDARNEMDKAFADASSLGAAEYYLQRKSETSSQNGDEDLRPNSRNEQLFAYLQTLTEKPIPGVGGQFVDPNPLSTSKGKLSSLSRDQLLVSMFDMVRWGVNPAAPALQTTREVLQPTYAFLPPNLVDDPGAWSAVPLRVGGHDFSSGTDKTVKGYGRFPTISEVTLVFAGIDAKRENDDPLSPGYKIIKDVAPKDDLGDETTKLQVFLVIEPFMVAPGVPAVAPHYVYEVTGLEDMEINGRKIGFKDGKSEVTYSPSVERADHAPYGGGCSPYAGFSAQFFRRDGTPRDLGHDDPPTDLVFPFYNTTAIVLPNGDGGKDRRLRISGLGVVTVSIRVPGTLVPVQTFKINMSGLNAIDNVDSSELPMPRVPVRAGPMELPARFATGTTPSEGPRMFALIRKGDVTRSFEPVGNPAHGDPRIVAGLEQVDTSIFKLFNPNAEARRADSLRDGAHMVEGQVGEDDLGNAASTEFTAGPLVVRGSSKALNYDKRSVPATIRGFAAGSTKPAGAAINADDRPGDFDNGPGLIEDGPYINMPDFNNLANERGSGSQRGGTGGWFQRGGLFNEENGVTYSPWRNASSAFIFGSLPTCVYGAGADPLMTPRPWETLLLCPNPASRESAANVEPLWFPNNQSNQDHHGFANPRDHLWLEFFWLPTVKPEGFCEGMATEGKVNMNTQMMPFTWIRRETALHGAMQGVRVTAIPSWTVSTAGTDHYKSPDSTSSLSFRYAVNIEETLRGMRRRFDVDHDVFRSPSEICDVFLVPKRFRDHNYGGQTPGEPTSYDAMMDWWEGSNKANPTDAFEATGDNARESPYAQLYPRLCTRSNVFTVHWRVQVLRKARSNKPDEWVEPGYSTKTLSEDHVVAEQRGQSMVERYLPPNAKGITDFATDTSNSALDDFYQYRVVNRGAFAP